MTDNAFSNPVRSIDQREQDKLNLKIWEKIDSKIPSDISEIDILSIVSGIFSSDYDVRTTALSKLNRLGTVAAQRLVDILVKKPTDSTLIFQVTYALEEIGKRAIPFLVDALKNMNGLKKPAELALMENITGTLIRLHDKSAVRILVSYINNIKKELKNIDISGNSQNNSQKKIYDFCQAARLRIHDLLGEMGSREGLNDLLLLLGDGKKRVHVDVIETMRKIGDQRALVSLLRLYPIELNISELGARYIKLTFREIVRREKVSREHSIFKKLSSEEKIILNKIFPPIRGNG